MKKEYNSPQLSCLELYSKDSIAAASDFITGSMSGGYESDVAPD